MDLENSGLGSFILFMIHKYEFNIYHMPDRAELQSFPPLSKTFLGMELFRALDSLNSTNELKINIVHAL